MAESLEVEIICPVCLELIFNPIFLSCSHIFCVDCIRDWLTIRGDLVLTCPLCRRENKTPVMEELHVEALTLLLKQHSSFLEQSLCWSTELLRFWVDVTLDSATAHSLLVLSSDLKTVHCGKICHNLVEDPRRFTSLACVLGSPCFSFGRHYWELKVGEGKEWSLGVCNELVERKRTMGLSPEHGFWIITLKAGEIHVSSTQEKIPARPGLCHVGILLDMEMGEIKFFDVKNGALICIPGSFIFSVWEHLRPFFYPESPEEGNSGAPLSICPQEIHASLKLSEVYETLDSKKGQNDQGRDNLLKCQDLVV
ncbi:ret finger protein-like 4B [Sciurus carolinensis]|uniref:ret finger protein-like 4B n=1 Tax=Sciurus carolinensis TaxID=30640 RepID=UPI001FB225F3|nr:ret finger protein-like 4B [Sciurus carolinensis]